MSLSNSLSIADIEKAKVEKLNTVCLKIIDTFISKNQTVINEELLISSDCKKVSE